LARIPGVAGLSLKLESLAEVGVAKVTFLKFLVTVSALAVQNFSEVY
jgi:hypothetical protein